MAEKKVKRYALCGVSARGIHMFLQPMYRTFAAYARPVALLDIDPLRFEDFQKLFTSFDHSCSLPPRTAAAIRLRRGGTFTT